MTCSVTVAFQEMPCSLDIKARVGQFADGLEHDFAVVEKCDTEIGKRHKHHMPGHEFHARLVVHLKGTLREAVADCVHENPIVALEAVFSDIRHLLAQVRLDDDQARARGHSGHVIELPSERGSCVVVSDAGGRFIAQADDGDAILSRLRIGDRVWFVPTGEAPAPTARVTHFAESQPRSRST